jgi:putative hydrolase of the HAD superfamily
MSSKAMRAVVFDYGMVLSEQPTLAQVERIAKIFGVDHASFWQLYEKNRVRYDRGDLTPYQYWRMFAADTATDLSDATIELLQKWDMEMWSGFAVPMLDWARRLRDAGYKTSILSNMSLRFARHLRNTAEWLRDFEHPIFSSEVNLAKPEPAIYQLCVDTLRVEPSEILFVDDREANVSAAQRLGLKAICFQSVDQLASDLKAFDFEIRP